MSQMKHQDLTANGTVSDDAKADTLVVMLRTDIGGGTVTVRRYSSSRDAFVPVAEWTEVLTTAESVAIGKGARFEIVLSGSTNPDLNIDYWFVN